jgi:cell migration-inducing and hyaluronan-binding protein
MNSRETNAKYRRAIVHRGSVRLGRILLVITMVVLGTQAAQADVKCEGGTCTCTGGPVSFLDKGQPWLSAGSAPDLQVSGPGKCQVMLPRDSSGKTSYYFKNVNILKGGILLFYEFEAGQNTSTDFWASSIIVENGGQLSAHGRDAPWLPFGFQGGVLTIHLYGTNEAKWNPVKGQFDQQNQGALCKTEPTPAPCGIPQGVWESNGKDIITNLPGGVRDFFYQYGPLHGDGKCDDGTVFKVIDGTGKCGDTSTGKVGYFGNKVLAVSYGGSLVLFGSKGITYDLTVSESPDYSGSSWMRLADGKSLDVGADSLVLERDPGTWTAGYEIGTWTAGDEIVVTTTDYLPGHSEKLQIVSKSGTTVSFAAVDSATRKIQWPHNGVRYGGPNDPKQWTTRLKPWTKNSLDPDLVKNGAETRAAVALLSRSIQIVSGGDVAGAPFGYHTVEDYEKGTIDPHYSYGGHMVIRQGFTAVNIQGVEFQKMGQGGRLGHYPVHFHMARQTPAGTYVKDSSINESMTRWIVLHSTLGVRVERNVGYKSIGHGFYLEDGTETDNKFYSNIGIFARAAVENEQNPRKAPGILAENTDERFPYDSDYRSPSVFWITNGWNDFSGNMAAGAGTCGACYWFVSAKNGDQPDVPTAENTDRTADGRRHQKWGPTIKGRYTYGYAGLQRDQQGATPLRSFFKNYCTSAMHSFLDLNAASHCLSVDAANAATALNRLKAVKSLAPEKQHEHYYPNADAGGFRNAVRCPFVDGQYQCAGATACGAGNNQCTAVVLDHYTSAFHWAENNFAAIWLRPQWTLVTNSVLSDVQNAGISIVTGGDYTHSSVIPGFWGVVRNTIFIGQTQPNDPAHAFARDNGPFNNDSRKLDPTAKCEANGGGYCLNKREGVSFPLTNFSIGQRMFSIYDGPAYQDSNVFLDIKPTPCAVNDSNCIYGFGTPGLRKYTSGANQGKCYMPNAAIAWKQPNGFIYPPAFHSTNLFFDNVGIRHYVIEPMFQAPAGVTGTGLDFGQGGTYLTDKKRAGDDYCGLLPDNFFQGFTGIDRQTILNDDDGSLTGLVNSVAANQPARLKQTISVNEDSFFDAPVKTAECKSNVGVDPNKACPTQGKLPATPSPSTAMTSPYDYVTTVVVPGCSLSGPRYGRCGDDDADEQKTCSGKFPNCCKVPGNVTSGNICRDRFSKMTGRGGTWSSECTNESCYGVPLYRQLLTGNDGAGGPTREWARWLAAKCDKDRNTPQCRWPFMRMAGENFYQRNTLTVNHGTYFIDTSVPREA